jgi:alpha-beta hydrolase superfamily lysophospholipase
VKEKGLYSKGADNNQIWNYYWEPDSTPKAVIALIHGFGEHSGRYAHWALRFAERDIAFCAFDLPGHGKSDGKRGYTKSYQDIISDIDLFLTHLRKTYPNIPIILYGHSMGGNLAINFAITTRNKFDMLIASSPWLHLSIPLAKWQKCLISILYKIYPQFTVRTPLNAEDMSHNHREVTKYKNDPLVNNRISIQLLHEVMHYGKKAIGKVYKINVPMLIVHGTADKVTSYKSSEKFARNTSDNITLKLWPDMCHEMHNDECSDELFSFIINWIDEKEPHIKPL